MNGLNGILYNDLYKHIFQFINFEEKLNYQKICKKFKQFKITDLYNIYNTFDDYINENYMLSYKDVTQLKVSLKENIYDIVWFYQLPRLKKLCVLFNGLDDRPIDLGVIKLEELCVSNVWIINIKSNPGLKKLKLTGNCFQNDDMKNYPNLEYLHIGNNNNIKDLEYMVFLKTFSISGNCLGLTNEVIQKMKIETLIICTNQTITKLNNILSLKNLTIKSISRILNHGIKNLKLESLTLINNNKISDINTLKSLKSLSIPEKNLITVMGFYDLNLYELNVESNNKITDLNHFTSLKNLNISWNNCGVSGENIKNLNLKELMATNNNKITDLNHMTSLIKLNISGKNCGVSNSGIKNLIKLEEISIIDNHKITDLNHFINLKQITSDSIFNSKDHRICKLDKNTLQWINVCRYNESVYMYEYDYRSDSDYYY